MINTVPTIFIRFPEGRAKALTFSYDDGFLNDVRLVELLNKHKLKGTFNISMGKCTPEEKPYKENSIWNYMKRSDLSNLFENTEHEVAIHGYSHPYLEMLPPVTIAHEVLHDRELLEEQFGRIIRGMAYPKGSYDDKVVEILKACGIVYSRTVKSTEKFDIPNDWLRLPSTCHHNNSRLMELANKFVDMEVKNANAQMFYIWGHTYEFYKNDNWNVIEEFCEFMAGREKDVWYATNIEIYEYIEDFKHLIYSADLTYIKNPTARTIWLALDNKVISIAPGETVKTR